MTPASLDGAGLIQLTPQGLYCPAAGAWIDPWRPVPRALITHAHADHARPGCGEYWAIGASEGILRQRLGQGIQLLPVDYGQTLRLGDARLSFHSAGHVLGSAQIRLEAGESWLISGDYKRDEDPSCVPFEPVTADVLITEATFGLPIYRWSPGREVARQVLDWWRGAPDRASILFCYAFGKAQRVLAELHALGVEEEVLLHGAVQTLMAPYREQGIAMVPTRPVSALGRKESLAGQAGAGAPLGPSLGVDEALPPAPDRFRERLDGGAGGPATAGLRTGFRAQRPCRLGRAAAHRAAERCPAGLRDPWPERWPGPLPAGGGRRRRHPIGGGLQRGKGRGDQPGRGEQPG